jgi:hypothetical protein
VRAVLRELTGTLVSAALLGGVGYFLYWRLKKDAAEIIPAPAKVAEGVKGIIVGAPSVLAAIVKGESAAGYITAAQQKALAEAALARKRALTEGV